MFMQKGYVLTLTSLMETWDFLQGSRLFFARRNQVLNDEQHLAEIVALLGPPPLEFLSRSEQCRLYWDDQGTALFLEYWRLRGQWTDLCDG